MKYLIINIFALFNVAFFVQAQNKSVELKNIPEKQVSVAGFILNSSKTISIKAVGAGDTKPLKRVHNFQGDKFNLYAYAWIINSTSRMMVWRMTIDNTKKDWWDKWNRTFEGEINLPKGRYELYFSAVEPAYFNMDEGFFSLGRLFDKIIGDDTWWEDHSKKWMCRVSGVDDTLNENDVQAYLKKIRAKDIVYIAGMDGQSFVESEFSLQDTLQVEIYAIGEGYKGKMYDYGMLINKDTRHKIWEMRESETEYAGGAVKNRLDRRKLTLNPGNYVAYFKSDGSHSLEGWNANPPYDPLFWGFTIRVDEKQYNPESIKKVPYKKKEPFVQLTRVGDDKNLQKSFTLEQPAWIKIWAIGEGSDDEMADYGWITNSQNGETVWKMEYEKTEHAGGSSKNREFLGTVHFDKGNYLLHFRTDDSHSYGDWNARPPDSPKNWGISLYLLSKEDSSALVHPVIAAKNVKSEILVQLTKIGDDEHRMKQLVLKKPTHLHILCLGEGRDGEMFDYGWIENMETRETVWKMNYNETQRAGGARKNRRVDSYIFLSAGTYRIHYKSDDSHSYRSWNDDSPDNVNDWGITVYEISEQ